MVNLINVKNASLITLLLFTSCMNNKQTKKESHFKVVEETPLNYINSEVEKFDITISSFIKVLSSKQLVKLDDFVFPEIKTFILKTTDSLNNISSLTILSKGKKGLLVKQRNDSTLVLCIGEVEPILGYTGGFYTFIYSKNEKRFKLYEIPILD